VVQLVDAATVPAAKCKASASVNLSIFNKSTIFLEGLLFDPRAIPLNFHATLPAFRKLDSFCFVITGNNWSNNA
jgi:hypothetical protein